MDKVQIRNLKKNDADEISRIYAAITLKPVDPDFKRVVEEHSQRNDEACFVAELKGKVVGFMISYILTAGFGMPKSAWIATLGVDPNFMGQGIGETLAEEKRLLDVRLEEEKRIKQQEAARLEREWLESQRQQQLLYEQKAKIRAEKLAEAETAAIAAAKAKEEAKRKTAECSGPAARYKASCR